MEFQLLTNIFWLNSMLHGADTVNHLPLNMLKLLLLLKLTTQLFLSLKLMPLNIKNQDLDLESKDSLLLNGSLTDNLLTILEVELKVPSFNGLKKRSPLLLLKPHLLKLLKNQPKLTKFWESSSLNLLNLMLTKLSQMSPKLLMMLFLLILYLLMLLLIMEPLKIPLFYSDNSMNLELPLLENSPLPLFLNGSQLTLYPLSWISIKLLLKEFSEITSPLFSYVLVITKPLKLLLLPYLLLLNN